MNDVVLKTREGSLSLKIEKDDRALYFLYFGKDGKILADCVLDQDEFFKAIEQLKKPDKMSEEEVNELKTFYNASEGLYG